SHEAAEAHEAAEPMCLAMAILAILCVAIGLAAPLVVASLASVVAGASGIAVAQVRTSLATAAAPLGVVVGVFAVLVVAAGLLWALRWHLLARAGVRRGPVWGCGYPRGTPRMQYTASSFAQPLTTQFNLFVRNRETLVPPAGYFPAASSYSSDSGDPFLRLLFATSFRWF